MTSAIQTQLNTKSPSANPTFSGTVTMPGTGIWSSNVGIGTNSPSAIDGSGLHIKGVNNATLVVDTTGATYDGQIKWLDNGILKWNFYNDGGDSHKMKMRMASGVDVITINQSGNVDVNGIVNAKGFNTQLMRVSDNVYATAVVGEEYYGPNQVGGFYGTVYRQYFTTTLPVDLTAASNITNLIDFQIQFTFASARYLARGSASDGTNAVDVVLSGTTGNGNLSLYQAGGSTILKGWVDYTK